MRIQDYHDLPKLRDSLSYLYLEHGKVERSQNWPSSSSTAGAGAHWSRPRR